MIPSLRSTLLVFMSLLVVGIAYACGGTDDNGGTDPVTTGTIAVTVRVDGATQAGVLVQRFAPGSSTLAAAVSTNNNGVATFSAVEAGNWDVEVVLPSGFELDQGEQGRKSVTVVASQTTSASFNLVDAFTGETIEANGSLQFSPSALTITAGTAVRWINASSVLHTVTPDGHSEWTAATLSDNGSTFVHTFSTPGTYQYFCQPHVGSGMTGTITVN